VTKISKLKRSAYTFLAVALPWLTELSGDFKGYFDVRNIKLDCHVDRFNIRRYNSPALACKYVFKNMLDTVYTEKELGRCS
jgi:hypothetical protein